MLPPWKRFIRSLPWEQVYLFLQEQKGIHTQEEWQVRRFFEGVCIVLRGGMQWRFLPAEYGSWRAVHQRFLRWKRQGVWDGLLQYALKEQTDLTEIMLDSTIVRAHACAAGYKKDAGSVQALGRSKGGFTTKVHMICEALGCVLKFALTPGQRHDITQASELIANIEGAYVIADKAYDSQELIDQIASQGCVAVIPPRKNRKTPRQYDKHIYKERHLIEVLFGKLKHFRRVFSRFDKTAEAYTAFIAIASTILWLR